MKIAHYLITRFNLPVHRPNKNGVLQDPLGQWLNHRCDLFERYCLPSVLAQSDPLFKWILLFDERTPTHILDKYSAHNILPVSLAKTEEEDEASVCQYALAQVLEMEEPGDVILTTRLDNDDMLYQDFVRELKGKVQQSFTDEHALFQFPVGAELDLGKGRWRKCSDHRSNAFISMAEPWTSKPKTAMAYRHREMPSYFPLYNVNDAMAWARIIHEVNLANDSWRTKWTVTRRASALKKKRFVFNDKAS